MHFPPVEQALPEWLGTETGQMPEPLPDVETRMRAVIELSRQNVIRRTGGPFAAAVFDRKTCLLVGAGVNRVVQSGLSIAHAEIMAISVAQQRVGTYDLGAAGSYELVTSSEPCAMCFGAVPWSGVSRLICGATNADVAGIGFDEGPRHPQWVDELERRGIEVQTEICRQEARQVLTDYAADNGSIYNGRQGD